MSAGEGSHAADPVTTKRMVTGLKRSYPFTRQAPDEEAEEEKLELSLGLAIGGGSKWKAAAGDGFLNGSASPVVGSVGICRARVKEEEIRTRNPVAPPAIPMRVPGSLNGSGFAAMFARRAPLVVSGSGQSGLNLSAPHIRSVPALPNPSVNLNHGSNPQCYANQNLAREMGGKRVRRAPSFSGSSAGGGRSSSSGEFIHSNLNPNATAEDAMSEPRTLELLPPPIRSCRLDEMPLVMTRGINRRKTTGILYRYNNQTEICIVCSCHGESLTPAEFVRHAGGAESSCPLRQIYMTK